MLKMLQTNCNDNTLKNDLNIEERMEELNKWQEEQKRLLDKRQNMQRKMLGLEQQNMYEKMGIFLDNDVNGNNVGDGGGDTSSDLANKYGNKENLEVDREISEMENRLFEGSNNNLVKFSNLMKLSHIYCNDEELEYKEVKPKRPYLKRGEGIKQRYKISPEAFRLNNLPRYKYATTHPKVKNLQRRRLVPKATRSQDNKNAKLKPVDAAEEIKERDLNEKQFQQISKSRFVYSSTPDEKSANVRLSSPISITLPNVRLSQGANGESNTSEHNEENEQEHLVEPYAAITWSKVLDPQQVKPIKIKEIRAASAKSENMEKYGKNTNIEDENLSIFELLERQAAQGTIDMNSSCMRKFLDHKIICEEAEENEIEIPIDKRYADKTLRPAVEEVLKGDSDNDEHNSSDEVEERSVRCQVPINSSYMSDEPKNDSTLNVDKVDLHVHFSEENTTCEYDNGDVISESSLTLDEEVASNKSSDLFHQFKEALFRALLDKNDGEGTCIEQTHPPPSALTQELQEKSNIIKLRLEELEKEIAAFRSNNMELIRAKQEYEMERAHFSQERKEALDRLKDDKIQMEMYLHDERIKIEQDRRKFEHQMRVQKQTLVNKERKEIVRLKEEIETLQVQLKQKDQLHASAQARLRVQIRNLERDQKQLYEDIERLTKENKRLENEKHKLEREGNNKMLMEINKNIAKLAPKLATVNACNIEYPHLNKSTYSKNLKSTHSPPIIQKSNGKAQRVLKGPPNTRNTSRTDLTIDVENPCTLQTTGMPKHHNETDVDLADDDDDENIISELQLTQDSRSGKTLQNLNISEGTVVLKHDRGKNENEKTNKLESATVNFGVKAIGNSQCGTETGEHFRREIINSDGSRDIWYPNGNLKKISSDGLHIRMLYFNKDIKETNVDEGTVKYYFAETNTWHTTYLDGLEILEFPNGQTEHRYKNGVVEIHLPDHSVKIINPSEKDKLEEWRFADGTNLIQMRNGDRVLILPNGQKEIHTKLNKRREYPDGTVKLVYPDGSQETRYSNGRVRLKDKDGNLVMDTERI
ncbi:putative autophagy-related protein 11 [Anastrepha obliqua]|uniref:putative autophagy-related protein 11 n=1 Tax=Anastrepha obliqua TaxID=95512 RepID=UPI00240A9496|nr:putative autophagy-related protein 11 [Anastrepha obliqua]